MDFWRTVEILGKRKWFILLSALVATSLTWVGKRLIGSTWTATVQFVCPRNTALMGTGGTEGTDASGESGAQPDSSQATIYAAIVKSRDVLEPSLKQINQMALPPDLLKNIVFFATAPRLYQLQVTDRSKTRAEQLANALADNFIKVNHAVRTRQFKETVALLQAKLRDADQRLAAARQRYDAYRNAHHIVGSLNADVDAALVRFNEARQKQDDTQLKLADARARMSQLEVQIAQTPPTVSAGISATAPAQLQQLQSDLAKADQQLADLRKRYTDQMPVVRRAQAVRDDLANRLKTEQGTPSGSMGSTSNPNLVPLRQQERSLKQEIAGDEALLAALTPLIVSAQKGLDQFKGLDGGVLASDVATQTEERNNLVARLWNASMLGNVTESQDPITILNRVSDLNPAIDPATGKNPKLLLVSALCALFATSGLVLGLDRIDRRLRIKQEAEIILPAPVLAVIPQPMREINRSALARVAELYPWSLQSEAYRFLGVRLLSKHLEGVQSLMLCSAQAEQGCTTSLANLGITLAQAGKRVVLIDANVRKSDVHHIFELPNQFGFTDLLQKPTAQKIKKALQPTTIPNLRVITSGQQPTNPWEAFHSHKMQEVAHHLREIADYILYDTPPIGIYTDALNLAPVVDAAVVCVRALEPVTTAADRLVKLLHEADVPVLGCVLSDVPATEMESYSSYQHSYPSLAQTAIVPTSLPDAPMELIARSSELQPWIDVGQDS